MAASDHHARNGVDLHSHWTTSSSGYQTVNDCLGGGLAATGSAVLHKQLREEMEGLIRDVGHLLGVVSERQWYGVDAVAFIGSEAGFFRENHELLESYYEQSVKAKREFHRAGDKKPLYWFSRDLTEWHAVFLHRNGTGHWITFLWDDTAETWKRVSVSLLATGPLAPR